MIGRGTHQFEPPLIIGHADMPVVFVVAQLLVHFPGNARKHDPAFATEHRFFFDGRHAITLWLGAFPPFYRRGGGVATPVARPPSFGLRSRACATAVSIAERRSPPAATDIAR